MLDRKSRLNMFFFVYFDNFLDFRFNKIKLYETPGIIKTAIYYIT